MRTPDEIRQQDELERARRDLTLRTQRLLGTEPRGDVVEEGFSLLKIRVEQRQLSNALRLK